MVHCPPLLPRLQLLLLLQAAQMAPGRGQKSAAELHERLLVFVGEKIEICAPRPILCKASLRENMG